MLSRPGAATSSRRRVIAAVVLLGVLAGSCSDDDDGGTTMDAPDDSLAETLSTLGGDTVADVEITHQEGSTVFGVGGLPIDVAEFAGYAELSSDRHVFIPPAWPTLRRRSDVYSVDGVDSFPSISWAVFRQTELVTDDDARAGLARQLWTHLEIVDDEVLHTSAVSSDDGVTCRTEIRLDSRFGTYGGVIFFAGPGIASSAAVTVSNPEPDALRLHGDIVESACGTRPDGL